MDEHREKYHQGKDTLAPKKEEPKKKDKKKK